MNSLLNRISCADDYDPESLGVEAARRIILDLIAPVDGSAHVAVREALGRVLAEDVISPMNVPGHDNSAMDGYAVRFADLAAEGEPCCGSPAPPSPGAPSTAASGRANACAS